MSDIETSLSDLLTQNYLPDDEKAKLYQQNLQRYLEFEKQRQNSPSIPVRPTENKDHAADQQAQESNNAKRNQVEREIIESVPKNSQSKAQRLVNRIKQNPEVLSWNERGEMLYEGKPVSGTNIVDLVRDVMTDRKNFQPLQRDLFSRGLAHVNTPLDWIGNENRKSAVQRYSGTHDSKDSEMTTPTTPKAFEIDSCTRFLHR